nr:hypothetical protein [Tanacetum cinerariifolium]
CSETKGRRPCMKQQTHFTRTTIAAEENRKALAPLKVRSEKLRTDKDLAEMCLMSSKKSEEDIFVNLMRLGTRPVKSKIRQQMKSKVYTVGRVLHREDYKLQNGWVQSYYVIMDILGSPLTDTVNKSFSQQVPIKRLEELRDMRSAKSEHA